MKTENQWLGGLDFIFPYLLLSLAAAVISITLVINRPDLTIFSLVLVIPLILASVFMLTNRNIKFIDLSSYLTGISFTHLFLFNLIVFVFSLIILLLFPDRPLSYFLLIAIYAGLIFLQVISHRSSHTDALVLLQICFLSLNLIWGLTLKYPLYFGDTDLLVHLNLIDTILQTGHVTTFYVDYIHYPLYHLFSAMGIQITGISVSTAVFIFMGIAWQIGILFSFLTFRYLTNSPRFALIATLLFASSSQIIYYGSYSIARSLAFVFFIAWIYLITNKAQKDTRYFFISLIFMAALIMTHHLNVIYMVIVLFVVYICQLLFNRYPQKRLINPMFLFLFSTAAVSYLIWVSSNVADYNLRATFNSILDMGSSIKSTASLTSGYGVSVIMGTIFYSFVLFLSFLGMKIVFDHFKATGPGRLAGVFALSGFIMLLVYVPGFLYVLPLSDIMLTDRFPLIVSPFVALLMAFGIQYLFNTHQSLNFKSVRAYFVPILSVLIIAITTYFSAISIGNANDTNYLPNTESINSQYFTKSEIQSFTFLTNQGNSASPIFSDYQTARNEYTLNKFPSRYILISGNVSYIESGYLVFRLAELQKKQALSFSPDGYKIIRYPAQVLNTELKTVDNSYLENLIYNDNAVQIYTVKPPRRG